MSAFENVRAEIINDIEINNNNRISKQTIITYFVLLQSGANQ